MQRRDFLKLTAAMSVASITQGTYAARESRQKKIVLVHLAGGNDGLNTLIPYSNPLYYQLRPKLAIPKGSVLQLDKHNGMHPSLKALMPYWRRGQLAWLQGIGYDRPDLSHFRSLDIWETASESHEYKKHGWLSDVLPQMSADLHGIVLGQGIGPLAGSQLNAVEMENPRTFLNQAKLIEDLRFARPDGAAMAHIIEVQNQLYSTAAELRQKLRRPVPIRVAFPKTPFGHQMRAIAQMIASGVNSPVYKARLDGFDTHAGQATSHKNSLLHLSAALDAFAKAMQYAGHWNDVLLITYSEFGRRLKENRSGGTDHGMASVQLVMGGAVLGGIYGHTADLQNMDDGNLPYTVDFKSIYGTVAQRWWKISNPWRQHGVLPFV